MPYLCPSEEQPETSKSSESGLDCGPLQLTWAACGMQGWRVGMEDAHIALPVTLPRRPSAAAPWTRTALFGVLDGHGGAEVARFSSDRLPQEGFWMTFWMRITDISIENH